MGRGAGGVDMQFKHQLHLRSNLAEADESLASRFKPAMVPSDLAR